MAKHSLEVVEISDNPIVNTIESVASDYISQQSWFKQHQNTILSVGQGVLQALNILLTIISGGTYPLWVTILVAVILSAAQVFVTAATSAPITPKNTEKLTEFVDANTEKSSIRDFYTKEQ